MVFVTAHLTQKDLSFIPTFTALHVKQFAYTISKLKPKRLKKLKLARKEIPYFWF